MQQPPPAELTALLQAWNQGDQYALERLTPLVYAQLHQLARQQLAKERAGHLLQPSALVNEAFVALIGNQKMEFANRSHFFAMSARLMRQILIQFARAQLATKRGQRAQHVDINAISDMIADPSGGSLTTADLIAVDAAIDRLGELDERQAKIVELRFFGGLSIPEVANVLGVSNATIVREWKVARAWLYDELSHQPNRDTEFPA